MFAFDKLGEFYLGNQKTPEKPPVIVSAEDLTTHAFIVGMTGSGKTGLALNLLEEALLDDVPVIAIDPKGDLTNLALQFPNLDAPEAAKWLGDSDAEVAKQREKWQKLRTATGLTENRIRALTDKLAVRVYTPGRADALPINTLPLDASHYAGLDDSAMEEKANAISIALLHRLGEYNADFASPAQVFLARVLLWHWQQQKPLDLAKLLSAVQSPPFDTVGLLDVEVFFPDKDRHALMLKLNTLIAAPGFDDWLSGPALDVRQYFSMAQAKVPVTIFSIAHLSDDDRQFFVQLLLAEIISWMRRQNGSDSLRALLYMDEIFGYIPPTANPPSKNCFLTLLKQARAYGLGLALATQNPVDLDYKGLSNIGTWMIGRLQTKRDRERLLGGLQQLRGQADFDVETVMTSLDKREFLLHSVHRAEPTTFFTRCVQSLMVGPLSIDQLRELPYRLEDDAIATVPQTSTGAPTLETDNEMIAPPVVNPRIEMRFAFAAQSVQYTPKLAALLTVFYEDKAANIHTLQSQTLVVPTNTAGALDWAKAVLDKGHGEAKWHRQPTEGIGFAELPRALQKLTPYTRSKTMIRKVALSLSAIQLLHYAPLGLTARPDETAEEFRERLALAIRNSRDVLKADLRAETQSVLEKLQAEHDKLTQKLAKEKSESFAARVSSLAKVGGALLSAFLSNKKLSVTNANRASSSIGAIGRANKQASDVKAVKAQLVELEQEIQQLEQNLVAEIKQLEQAQPDVHRLPLKTIEILPKQSDIEVAQCFLVWM